MVQEDFGFVMKYKWRLTKFDKTRYKDFLPEKMRNELDKPEKKTDDTPTWIYVVSGIIVLGILILIAPVLDVLFPWLLAFAFILWCFSR